LQNPLSVLPTRHPKPERSSVALDVEPKVQEGAAQALQGDELRDHETHGGLRGVAESITVRKLPDLPDIRT
jgi:hypothetical protein